MSIRCVVGLHKWTQWSIEKQGQVTARSGYNPTGKRVIGEVVVQSRQCECCKKRQYDVTNLDLV